MSGAPESPMGRIARQNFQLAPPPRPAPNLPELYRYKRPAIVTLTTLPRSRADRATSAPPSVAGS
jgi:hypothetical protein